MTRFSHPALALRATIMAALLTTAGLAHSESVEAPEAGARSDSPVRAVFSAYHPRFGSEPWITDGTREGTQLLRDIYQGTPQYPPQPNSSDPWLFADLGDGRVAFTARFRNREYVENIEPFITDGTREGTRLVKSIGAEVTSTTWPRGYTALGDGRFVFAAYHGEHPQHWGQPCVWVSDGSARSTKPLVCPEANPITVHLGHGFTQLRQGAVVFALFHQARGYEPWITDGTRAGTRILRDTVQGEYGGNPQEFTRLADDVVLFTVSDDGFSRKLWVTDGTREGTRVLTDTSARSVDGRAHITPIGGGKAVFSGDFELWVTDGTPAGTRMVPTDGMRDVPWIPSNFASLGDGRALFTALGRLDSLEKLWVTDGTARGTRSVQEIEGIHHLRALGDGRVIFWQLQQDLGYFALWVSDGTRRGTSRVQQFPNMTSENHQVLQNVSSMGDGRALFAYDNGRTGWEPWITDGTRAGTNLVRNIGENTLGSMGYGRFQDSFTPFIPAQN